MKLIKKSLSFITAIACCAAISGIMPFSSSAEESVKTYGDLSYVSSDSDGDRIYDYIAIIDCNESGIIMLVKFAQPLNALLSISTTGISSISAGISIFVTDSLQSIIAI